MGTCALRKVDDETYELVKMAVTPAAQGRGIGAELAGYAVERARKLGARRVVLETNSRLRAANRVYEKLGFVRTERGPSGEYERADVAMELRLRV